MNAENLKKMADYIETVPKYKFDMIIFRAQEHADDFEIIPDDPQEKVDISAFLAGRKTAHECGGVGCILGHCTVIDRNPLPMDSLGEIDGYAWSLDFTGLGPNSIEWHYLFAGFWIYGDNTPTGAASRIRHFLEKGVPDDWRDQMLGRTPLSYM